MLKIGKYASSQISEEGQSNKLCDIIADALLDEYLKLDSHARVDLNVLLTKEKVIISGEVTSSAKINVEKIVRGVIGEIGFTDIKSGIDPHKAQVEILLQKQSQDLSRGIVSQEDDTLRSGDQGTVYGYAIDETPELLPLSYVLSKKIIKRLTYVRKSGLIEGLFPDAQVQVITEYEEDKPKRIDSIALSAHHGVDVDINWLRMELTQNVLEFVCKEWLDKNTTVLINTAGRFTIGGPSSDTGSSGHIIDDETYGGYCKFGGLTFSGKDPSKINRTCALMARKVAKDIVSQKMARECEIGVSYATGVADPVAVRVNTYGTSFVYEDIIADYIKNNYSFKISEIIEQLDLLYPKYKEMALIGHFNVV